MKVKAWDGYGSTWRGLLDGSWSRYVCSGWCVNISTRKSMQEGRSLLDLPLSIVSENSTQATGVGRAWTASAIHLPSSGARAAGPQEPLVQQREVAGEKTVERLCRSSMSP